MTAIWQNKSVHTHKVLLDWAMICGYGLLIALSAQYRVYLPFSPVPITAQTLTVLLAGWSLGPKRGVMAVLVYLIFGSSGLLPFAGGSLLGPTGGYLVGFVMAVYLIGSFTGMGLTKTWWSLLVVLIAGNAVIYVFGIPWLSLFVGWRTVLSHGFTPFIIGDLLKIACAFGIWRVVDLQRQTN